MQEFPLPSQLAQGAMYVSNLFFFPEKLEKIRE
jgi:hypothetical protein